MNKNGTSAVEGRVDSLKESVRNLVDVGSEKADVLKHKAIDVKDLIVSGSSTAARKVGSLIKEHPFAALGIALGIGYITMRLLRR